MFVIRTLTFPIHRGRNSQRLNSLGEIYCQLCCRSKNGPHKYQFELVSRSFFSFIHSFFFNIDSEKNQIVDFLNLSFYSHFDCSRFTNPYLTNTRNEILVRFWFFSFFNDRTHNACVRSKSMIHLYFYGTLESYFLTLLRGEHFSA